ncbi:MAG: class E sortase [Aeromicrobium sp.]
MAEKPRNTRRRQSALTVVGVAFILAGLGFLGYVGWQYYGTDVVSKHKQAEVKKSLVHDWGKGIDGDAVGLLRVPRFGKDYEVPIVTSFDKSALARGVGWYEKGAKPGEIGNFAIAGHRVTHGEPFRDFPKLRKGDKVEVETRTRIFTYKLRNDGTDITVDFSTSWPLQAVPVKGKQDVRPTEPMITMLTCSELFHTRDRSVVLGDLVATVSKPGTAKG